MTFRAVLRKGHPYRSRSVWRSRSWYVSHFPHQFNWIGKCLRSLCTRPRRSKKHRQRKCKLAENNKVFRKWLSALCYSVSNSLLYSKQTTTKKSRESSAKQTRIRTKTCSNFDPIRPIWHSKQDQTRPNNLDNIYNLTPHKCRVASTSYLPKTERDDIVYQLLLFVALVTNKLLKHYVLLHNNW